MLLQDWTPLGQCLDVRVGQAYWPRHAADLFADHRVPNLAHDSGSLSQRNARVLFAWCGEQAARGALPEQIVLVELGMGTGLHLRFLLDAFRDRCQAAGTDWYGRVVAYGTDISVGTVRKAVERGLFAAHAGHVRLGYMDVNQPGWFGELDTGAEVDLRGRIHALYANYVLDLLPVDVFRRTVAPGAPRWEAVLVRTWLRDPHLLPAYTDLAPDALVALAGQATTEAEEQLAAAYTLFQNELRAWPVDLANHPDLDEIERVADAQVAALGADHPLFAEGVVVNHSAGALRAAQLLGLVLAEAGYASFRDVGYTTAEIAGAPRTYQKYGPTAAAGVNLVQLDGFFATGLAAGGARLHRPTDDGVRHQASRLLTRAELPATVAEFTAAFDAEDVSRAAVLVAEARETADNAVAMDKYREALLLEPGNWHLMAEAARRALAGAQRPDVALAIAFKGLEINTEYSPELWNVFGDAHHALGDLPAARYAYEQGLLVHPRHPRLHYCAGFVAARQGRFEQAFRHLGEALAWDRAGDLRGDVLQLLDACLRGQATAHAAEQERLAARNDR